MQVRIGFDLEPVLPDPAPAFADPDGAFHPALIEGLAALPLHSYPTPAARSALVSQVLSEPGRPNLADPQDPFLTIYRHAIRHDMEPEVTGNLALLLIRGQLAQIQRQHRPQLGDPVQALLDPNHDPWRHRRGRLHSTDWSSLWNEVNAAADLCGSSDCFAFEQRNLRAARTWLLIYRSWWQVAALFNEDELCPDQPAKLALIEDALRRLRKECAAQLKLDDAESSCADLLSASIKTGVEAEAAFVEATGSRPSDGPINARWLLNQQLRSLRHITLVTREHSLRLHELLRQSDIARVAVQVTYRAALIELWLADLRGLDTDALEESLMTIPGPAHPSTLGAGLGRVLGAVLVRRLRRGKDAGALPLAEMALQLAPEELAVRMAWNDLRYQHRIGWDTSLVTSLRAEYDRWQSLPVLIMGSRVAKDLGDRRRTRWFRDQLIPRALNTSGFGPWALLVMESLAAEPGRARQELLEMLEDDGDELKAEPDAATWVLFGSNDKQLLDLTFKDLQRAVRELLTDIADANNLVPTQLAVARGSSQPSAWQQLISKAIVATDDPRFPGTAWTRVQDIRAAAPDLRRAPVAAQIRLLQELLSRSADILQRQVDTDVPSSHGDVDDDPMRGKVAGKIAAACAGLSELMQQVSEYLSSPTENNAQRLAQWLGQQMDPLRVAVREPRALALSAEADRLTALARARNQPPLIERVARLRANIARARTEPEADASFTEIEHDLSELSEALFTKGDTDPTAEESQIPSQGTMTLHAEFEQFSADQLGILPDALRRALEMVRLFNLSGGRRDRKRLKGKRSRDLFELRHRTSHTGGLRVFYERSGRSWQALAAMSKYDDRQQREAIERVRLYFQEH